MERLRKPTIVDIGAHAAHATNPGRLVPIYAGVQPAGSSGGGNMKTSCMIA